ncbi:hypothetical protein LIA77_04983 [Sarocladium implicatum]|nr:hypothetical protein LIA77_04983 [Sarocladium implicatum]
MISAEKLCLRSYLKKTPKSGVSKCIIYKARAVLSWVFGNAQQRSGSVKTSKREPHEYVFRQPKTARLSESRDLDVVSARRWLDGSSAGKELMRRSSATDGRER